MANKSNLQPFLRVSMFLLAMAGLAQAATITVGPGAGCDFETIQAGIDAANDTDTVLVSPGEYVILEPITFRGKAITVISEAGPDETTIRMGIPTDPKRGSVVVFENHETTTSLLGGFTIVGGRGSSLHGSFSGGGIIFNTSSGTVKNCVIAQNRAEHGGGLFIYSEFPPILIECAILDNTATNGGGLVIYLGSSLTLSDCTVRGNTAKNAGGVMVYSESSMTLTNCIVRDNSATGVTSGVDGYGGGLSCVTDSSLILTNCTIKSNSAVRAGGGIHIWQNSSAVMTGCNILENSVGESAGGVNCTENSSATMTNCIIRDNSSALGQGGVCCTHGSITMSYCEIIGNEAQDEAGGMYIGYGSTAVLSNCFIALNTAHLQGGGGVMCSRPGTSLAISNCTIWGNSGGSRWGGGGVLCRNASASITNSIIWKNTAPKGSEISVVVPASTLIIDYSNVAGGQVEVNIEGGCILNWGPGNIDTDPLFAQPGYWADINDPNVIIEPNEPNALWIDGDYHLKSEAGRWDPNSQSWIQDDVTSPCIDRGDPNIPVGDEPDPNGGIINMGAYGGTPEASMSIGQLPPFPPLSPLTHWRLDEVEGGTACDSAGDKAGLLFGGPEWRPDEGMVAGALQFDGIDDYISTDFVLDPSCGAFSVFAWVKGGAPGQVIISQSDGIGTGDIWLGSDASDGKLMTGLAAPPIGRFKPEPLISESIISDGRWHHIGFVWNGSYRILYTDGIEVAKDIAAQNQLKPATGGLYIGVDKTLSAGTFFSGLIDDVRIYNTVLTAEEIEALTK